jgi:hypothetical protein
MTACSSLFPSAPPRALVEERAVAARGADRARDIRLIMLRDLDRLGVVSAAALDGARDDLAPPAPRALFKLATIACLNQDASYLDDPDAPTRRGFLFDERVPTPPPGHALFAPFGARIDCAPVALAPLAAALASGPSARARSISRRLAHVDEARALRDTLRARVVKIPDLARQSRARLARERAELRRVTAKTEASQGEFGPAELAQTRASLRAWRDELRRWEREVDALENASIGWAVRLDTDLRRLYLGLSEL